MRKRQAFGIRSLRVYDSIKDCTGCEKGRATGFYQKSLKIFEKGLAFCLGM